MTLLGSNDVPAAIETPMMAQLSQWVGSLPISLAMRRITWLVPMLQTLHILSTGIVLSSVVMIDMRVWGASRSDTAIARSERFMPWTWTALAVAALTGIGLMLASPRSFRDSAFVAKLYLMAAAMVATAALPSMLRRNACGGKDAGVPARLVGLAALLLWLGAALAGRGRWIAGMLGG
jgi:uncharacterized membrane protein